MPLEEHSKKQLQPAAGYSQSIEIRPDGPIRGFLIEGFTGFEGSGAVIIRLGFPIEGSYTLNPKPKTTDRRSLNPKH